jgi:hypothetical protein
MEIEMELVNNANIVTFADRALDERDRDGAGDWHGPNLPALHRPDTVILNANDILGRDPGGQGWAQTGGTEGKGTKDAPEHLTVSETMALATAVSAGVGVQVAGSLIGTEAIIAAGATTVTTLVSAAGAAVFAAAILGVKGGQLLNETQWMQDLVAATTDYLVYGNMDDLKIYDQIKTPNVTPVGPWPAPPPAPEPLKLEGDASINSDHLMWFSLNSGDTSVVMWDTPVEALAASEFAAAALAGDLVGLMGGFNLFALFYTP